MLVSNSSNLLNILLPNDNKALKEVLKNADAQTLEKLNKGSISVGDVLKNLFDDLKTGDKNKSNIENILKNSNLFKDMGSFTKSVTTLLNQIETNPQLEKFKPILQNFLKDVSNLDDKALKDLIGKSGVFLESKVLNQSTSATNLPKDLETLLNQIKNVLTTIPSVEAKKIETLIDKLLQNNQKSTGLTQNINTQNQALQNQNNNDLKSIITSLQNLSTGLGDKQLNTLTSLTNTLKNISSQGLLVESKINNLPKSEISGNQILQEKQGVISKTSEVLTLLKNEIVKNTQNIPNMQNIVKQIDSLVQSNDLFSKNITQIEPKILLNQLVNLNEIKIASNQNSNINSLVSNLRLQSESIETLENKLVQNTNIQSEKTQLTQNIQQTLSSLRTELLGIKTIDKNALNQIIDKLLNIQNIFSKIELPLDVKNLQQNLLNQPSLLNNFQSNFTSNLNSLILTLKENIINLSSNQTNLNLQSSLGNNIEKLESLVKNIVHNQNLPIDKQLPPNTLQNDMKAVLLQMQTELSTKSDASSIDTFKQVEKMLMQIDYHQLLSIASNTNSVYIPFLWDMLDDGSIAMKKLDEEKFYCEINLSLKEFGQTQLLLSLYDKNKLDLTIYASKENFKEAIKENISKLKQALNSVDLIPTNIHLIDMKKDETSIEQKQTDAFSQNLDIGFGVDIRV